MFAADRMTTLGRLLIQLSEIPMATACYLADLAEAKGRQLLYTRQAPQRLKALREHAMIESAVASNRIEGAEIDPSRVRSIVLGRPAPRDRNEEEVRGYPNALKLIHESARRLEISGQSRGGLKGRRLVAGSRDLSHTLPRRTTHSMGWLVTRAIRS